MHAAHGSNPILNTRLNPCTHASSPILHARLEPEASRAPRKTGPPLTRRRLACGLTLILTLTLALALTLTLTLAVTLAWAFQFSVGSR